MNIKLLLTPLTFFTLFSLQVKSITGYLNPSFPDASIGSKSSFVISTPSRRRLRNGGMLVHGFALKMQGKSKQKKTKITCKSSILLANGIILEFKLLFQNEIWLWLEFIVFQSVHAILIFDDQYETRRQFF